MTEHIPLQETAEYRIGAVTYKVAAHFNADETSLYNKISRLLVNEIRKNGICTFAEQKDNAVE